MSEDEKLRPVSNLRLYATASAIGLAGMLLILLQALWMIPRQQASPLLLLIFICIPMVSQLVLPLLPRRRRIDLDTRYEWTWPVVYIELGLPVLLTFLSLFLVGLNHDYDSISGVPMFLALWVGADIGHLFECLWLRHTERRLNAKH